jgi:hypothetical protein
MRALLAATALAFVLVPGPAQGRSQVFAFFRTPSGNIGCG